MSKFLWAITTLLLCLSGLSFAAGNLIPLNDNAEKNGEYSSVLCFRFSYTSKSGVNSGVKMKDQFNHKFGYTLHYFNGPQLSEVPFDVNCFTKDRITYMSDVIYFAAKPGKYDLIGIFFSSNAGNMATTYSYPVNAVLDISAGKAYYAGEVIINVDENSKYTWNLFTNITINDSFTHDFESRHPNTFGAYKNDLVPVTFMTPSPVQPSGVEFSSHFAESEGIWKESNDSLHTASFENGKYCIESKSESNMGAEIIELPKILGNSFDIELRCTWKEGVKNSRFGFIIPDKGLPATPGGELEPRGYVFAITASGYASVWFESVVISYTKVKSNNKVKTLFNLTNWTYLPVIKANGSGYNTIRLQVIDNIISFYVNDFFVVRAPYNSAPGFSDKSGFLYTGSKLLGVFSCGKQKIEFNDIKVSRFK
jgi:hypothetical protein